MKTGKAIETLCLTVLILLSTPTAHAETMRFGEGDDQFEIEFVPIGLPGNAPDTRVEYFNGPNIGQVDYEYHIGKFEIPCELVNAFSESRFDNCRFNGAGSAGSLDDIEAREFVNWLNALSGYPPAYIANASSWESTASGYNSDNPRRNSNARFFLPTGDEFHKAAFFDPVSQTYLDYSTGSNVAPTPVSSGTEPNTLVINRLGPPTQIENAGGLSAFGTMAQVGNSFEMEEELVYISAGVESITGFSHERYRERFRAGGTFGFRVVSVPPVPEPGSAELALTGCIAVLAMMRRRKRTL